MVSRLPWSKELPRLWIATMRPTPVMIPVNMALFSQRLRPAMGRADKAGLKEVASPDSGHDTQIGPQAVGRAKLEVHRLRKLGNRTKTGHAAALAYQFRGQVDQKLIDQVFADQRPVEL